MYTNLPTANDGSAPHLVAAVDAWDSRKDEFAFIAMVWKYHGEFYYYRHCALSYDSEAELFKQAKLIPRDFYQGTMTPELTVASVPITDPDVYLKRMEPYTYDPNHSGPVTPGNSMSHEAQICEEIMRSPHPNVCRYLGYFPTDDGKHMAGLCYARHGSNLSRQVEQNVKFDKSVVIAGIRQGLEHLHSFGFVHNDVNPHNVVLDKNLQPVINDFDSCRRIGESLKGKKAGTMDWTNNSDFSDVENDWFGLRKIEDWLDEKIEDASAASE